MNNNEKRLVAQAIFETLFSSGQGFAIQKEGERITALISSEAAIDEEGDKFQHPEEYTFQIDGRK